MVQEHDWRFPNPKELSCKVMKFKAKLENETSFKRFVNLKKRNIFQICTQMYDDGTFHMTAKGTFITKHNSADTSSLLNNNQPFVWENFLQDGKVIGSFSANIRESSFKYPMFRSTYSMNILHELCPEKYGNTFFWETTSGDTQPVPDDVAIAYGPSFITTSPLENGNGTKCTYIVRVIAYGCNSNTSRKKIRKLFSGRLHSTQKNLKNILDKRHPQNAGKPKYMRDVIHSLSEFCTNRKFDIPDKGVPDNYVSMVIEYCNAILNLARMDYDSTLTIVNPLKRKFEGYQEYGKDQSIPTPTQTKPTPRLVNPWIDNNELSSYNSSYLTQYDLMYNTMDATTFNYFLDYIYMFKNAIQDIPYIMSLPNEIMYKIVLNLGINEINSISCVSKYFNSMINCPSFWVDKYNISDTVNKLPPRMYNTNQLDYLHMSFLQKSNTMKTNSISNGMSSQESAVSITHTNNSVINWSSSSSNINKMSLSMILNAEPKCCMCHDNEFSCTIETCDCTPFSTNICGKYIQYIKMRLLDSMRWRNLVMRGVAFMNSETRSPITSLNSFDNCAISLSRDSTVKFWSLEDVKSKFTFRSNDRNNPIITIDFDKSSNINDVFTRVWIGKANGVVKLYDIIQDEIIIAKRPLLLCEGFDFSNNKRHVGWEHFEVECYDFHTFKTLWRGIDESRIVTAKIINTSINKYGYLVTAHEDGSLWIRNMSNGLYRLSFGGISHGRITSIIQIGDTLFATGSTDHYLKIWDIRYLDSPIFSSNKHHSRINCLNYSEKEGRIFTGASDGTVMVWNLNYWCHNDINYHDDALYGIDIGTCTAYARLHVSNFPITSIFADNDTIMIGNSNGEIIKYYL